MAWSLGIGAAISLLVYSTLPSVEAHRPVIKHRHSHSRDPSDASSLDFGPSNLLENDFVALGAGVGDEGEEAEEPRHPHHSRHHHWHSHSTHHRPGPAHARGIALTETDGDQQGDVSNSLTYQNVLSSSLTQDEASRATGPEKPKPMQEDPATQETEREEKLLKKKRDFDAKLHKSRRFLPEWQLVGLSALAAGIGVILTAKIGECLVTPSKQVPSEAEQIKAELEEAQARSLELEKALEEKAKEEAAAAAAAAGEDKPPEPVGIDALNADELIGGMHSQSRHMQKSMDQALEAAHIDELMQKAEMMQSVFTRELTDIQGRAKDWGTKEAQGLYEKVSAVAQSDVLKMAADLNPTAMAGSVLKDAAVDGMVDKAGQAKETMVRSMPAFGLLLGASFAPSSVASVYYNAKRAIIINGILLATIAGIAAVGWKRPCLKKDVWYWAYALAATSALTVLANSAVQAKASHAMVTIENARAAVHVETGNPTWDFFMNIKSSSKYLFKALFLYDQLVSSFVYNLAKTIGVAYVVVGSAGVYFSIANIIDDTQWCEANGLITFMHIVSFFFVVFLTWTLVGLALWIVMLFASSKTVSSLIVKLAMKLDGTNPLNLPIFVTFVRSVILRSSLDIVVVQKEIVTEEIGALEAQAKECTEQLAKRKAEIEALEAQESAEKKSEDELVELYESQVKEGLDCAMPVVSLIAAQQKLQEQAAAAAATLHEQAKQLDTEAWQKQATEAGASMQQQANDMAAAAQKRYEEEAPALQAHLEQASASAGAAVQQLQEAAVQETK